MQLIKRLTSSFLGLIAGIFIFYFVTGENVDWMLVGLLVGINLFVMVIVNGKLGKKLKSKNK